MNGIQLYDNQSTIEPRWLFPVLDVLLVCVAFALAYIIRYDWQVFRPVFDPSRAEFAPYIPYMLVYTMMLSLNYQGSSLYRPVRGRAWLAEVSIIANGVTAATVVLLALFFLLQPEVTSRLMLVYVAFLTVALLSISRLVRRLVLSHLRSKGIGLQRVLLVGFGTTGQAILRTMLARRDLGYKVVGFLDDNPQKGEVDMGRVVGLGKLDNLTSVVREYSVNLVIITLRWKHYYRIMQMARDCRELGVQVRIVPDIFQLNMRQVQVENLDGIPLLGVDANQAFQGTNRFFKRLIDMGIVLLAAPVWVPVMVCIALLIRLNDKGPVFYKAKRIGENGKEFVMLKFRTMVPNADALRQELILQTEQDPKRPKIENDPRVTPIGKFLRSTSLDELPNLINVMRGQMSLVGPRPPMPDEVAEYEPWHLQRLQIIPGMTGLWQISGRSDVPFDEMCLLDIYYIENWSVKLDLQILLMTVPRVLMRSGAY